jgi:prepilin-type N-terminal cleavage/methylation domain-containing protein
VRRRAPAFTLIELLVALAIIGLLAAALAPSLGSYSRARLQDHAFKLSRMSRSALIWALSRATTVRLVIDLDESAVSAEEAVAPALVDESGSMVESEAGDAGEEAGAWEAGASAAGGEEGDGGGGGLLGGLGLGLFGAGSSGLEELYRPPRYRSPRFLPIDDPRLRPYALHGVKAIRVYYPGVEEPIEEGRAYVLYHDDGTADEAVIHVEDDKGRVYAVHVQPLTGRGVIYPYPFVPEAVEMVP